ncbi:MAG: type II toxin-antitoxin system HicB family antitoxin [Stecheria intestinalis]|nr:type II toxin-antitoxin system HicB family antitoxin [Stecheria intestinalis]
MKTIDYYMSLPYRLEIFPDPDEGGYVARYPELPGCITTGETLESAAENAADAKKAWLEAALEDGTAIPDPAPVKE